MPKPRRPVKNPFKVRRGKKLGKRRTIVTTRRPHRVFRRKNEVIIRLGKKKRGGKNMPSRRRPVRRPKARTRASVRGKGGQNLWKNRGVATELNVRGQNLPIRVGRPTAQVTRERGFQVQFREVGPKKKKLVL